MWLRALAVVYPFVTGFAVLATGNHFVLDILGGLATIAVSLLIVRLLEARGSRLRELVAGADGGVAPGPAAYRVVTKLLRSRRPGRLGRAVADR